MTSMTESPDLIDAQRALELLERAVAERGDDYVYPRVDASGYCVYVHDGQPSCLVGLALTFAGVTVEQLDGLDNDAAEVLHDYLPFVTEWAASVFSVAQVAQDGACPWGAALASAREYAAEVLPA